LQREEKPLAQISREALIQEVQQGCVVVGAHQFATTITGVGEALERLLFWSTLGRAYR